MTRSAVSAWTGWVLGAGAIGVVLGVGGASWRRQGRRSSSPVSDVATILRALEVANASEGEASCASLADRGLLPANLADGTEGGYAYRCGVVRLRGALVAWVYAYELVASTPRGRRGLYGVRGHLPMARYHVARDTTLPHEVARVSLGGVNGWYSYDLPAAARPW